jgi:magnesium chelatase subunit I
VAAPGRSTIIPEFMTEIVAAVSQAARRSPHVNQRSGVSVRMSIANYETMIANATRRALRNGEDTVVPRISDLEAIVASTSGKVEFETVDDGREAEVLDRLVKAATLETFRHCVDPANLVELVGAFDGGLVAHTGPDLSAADYATLSALPGVQAVLAELEVGDSPAEVASVIEFVLEGLHLAKRLNKEAVGGRATYRGRG